MDKSYDSESFKGQLVEKCELVNRTLGQILADQGDIEDSLREAMSYTLEGGGKRIRSALVLWCCELFADGFGANALTAAAAIEMVHTYSLVHDDLPAMDDDDLRRGRATCHKAFDEATAILAGDGLLTLAFEILASKVQPPQKAVELIRELAEAAGPAGMVGGQMADLRAENTPAERETLEYIHLNKTAKMFGCAAAMGGVCGDADREQIDLLRRYGLKIGLGFQVADDILDVCASSEQLGKTAGKDSRQGKATYPGIVGMADSRKLAKELAEEAIAVIEPFGPEADILRQLAQVLLARES